MTLVSYIAFAATFAGMANGQLTWGTLLTLDGICDGVGPNTVSHSFI